MAYVYGELMAATERIPLLVTSAQKALFTKRAKAS